MKRSPSGGLRSTLRQIDATGSSAEERDHDRHRRIAVATVAGVGSKVLVASTFLLAVPLAASRLTPAELGVWSVLMAAVALVGWADLGLGNGLLNLLNAAIGRDDPSAARRAVAAALTGLTAVAVLMAAAAAAAIVILPWDALFGLRPGEVAGVERAVAAFALTVIISIPAGIGQRIHLAHQQGWAASSVAGAGSALSLALVWLVARSDAGLTWFVLAVLGGTTLAYLAETAWVLGRSHRQLRPTAGDLDRATLRRLGRAGGGFFALVLAGALAYQTDALVIANHLGPTDATAYVVTNRLFALAPTMLGAALLPLWPAYGEAIARGDRRWVRQTLRRSLLLTLVASAVAAILLALVADAVLERWMPSTPAPNASLIVAMAAWSVVTSVSLAVASYLNGAHLLRLQVTLSAAMAAANLPASIVLVRVIGAPGPVWATVVSQTLLVLVPVGFVLRRTLGDREHPAPIPAPPHPLPTPGALP